MSFLEVVKNKTGKAKKGTDATILKNYVTYHSKCARNEKGKKMNGAFVENEIIAVVAHQNNIIINVAEHMVSNLQVITPDATFMRFDAPNVEASPFLLWCNGGHYQAIVPLASMEVLSTALTQESFKIGNVLRSEDFRTQ
jgi:hypothetical protein